MNIFIRIQKKKKRTEINFSKVIIRDPFFSKLGLHHNRVRLMKLGEMQVSFNYWDYIYVFNNFLYYENFKTKYSYFIRICPIIFNTYLPYWLIQLWLKFGAELNIIPKLILAQFLTCVESHPKFTRGIFSFWGGEYTVLLCWKWNLLYYLNGQ